MFLKLLNLQFLVETHTVKTKKGIDNKTAKQKNQSVSECVIC